MPKKIICPDGTGWCGKCKRFLPRDEFRLDPTRPGKLTRRCKECAKLHQREVNGSEPLVIPPPGHKYCPQCDTIKPDDQFHPGKLKQTQLRSMYCKPCASDIAYRLPPKRRLKNHFGTNHKGAKKCAFEFSDDPAKLAYAAAVFDAEGCAQFNPGKSCNPMFGISADSEAMLNAISEIIGGTVWFSVRMKNFKGEGPRAVSNGRLTIGSMAHIAEACKLLMPYLVLKKERCQLLIDSVVVCPEDRIKLRERSKQLNAKGTVEDAVVPETKVLSLIEAIQIADVSYAYLAGFIDGDGWIGMSPKSTLPKISIKTTKVSEVVHIHGIFGGTIESRPPRKENEASTVALRFRCDRVAWEEVLTRLSKYLVLKKKHAEMALSAMDGTVKDAAKISHSMSLMTSKSRREKFDRVDALPISERVFKLGLDYDSPCGRFELKSAEFSGV